ncbi:GNAT family acetyltransferase [Salinarimonas sp.]|uniref:GNAT family acetyltransferase n=1 Tax=Salinarimonas sp. TaxID=2766526 RepID=UPI0032D95219
MKKLYEGLALVYFVIATLAIMLLAFLLIVSAIWNVVVALPAKDVVDPVLEGIGLLIIGFAVVETAKFIAEEEILRRRELRSAVESRRSLTKFVTIIVIAASLEALVMVFKTSRASIPDAIYPAALFIAAMAALVALGGYQWLSSRINPEIPPGDPSGHGRDGNGDGEQR